MAEYFSCTEEKMERRIQGFDGACDLPPLPTGLPGPIPLGNFKQASKFFLSDAETPDCI